MGNDKPSTIEQSKPVETKKETSENAVLEAQRLFREQQKKNEFNLFFSDDSADQFLPKLTIGDKTKKTSELDGKSNLNTKFSADTVEMAKDSRSMIQQIRVDGNEGSLKYFAGVLPTMDSAQLSEFEKQFAKTNGRSLSQEFEALQQEGKLSPATAEILNAFLIEGKEVRFRPKPQKYLQRNL